MRVDINYLTFEVPALTYKTGDSDATEDPSQLRVMRHSASAHSYAVWRQRGKNDAVVTSRDWMEGLVSIKQ